MTAREAEERIIYQLMQAVEDARIDAGLSASDTAARAGIRLRQWRNLVSGRATSIRRLIQVAESCGLELHIGVRAKRKQVAA